MLQTVNQGLWNASLQWRRDDLFAAIPPLESRRAILAICGAREAGRHPYRIMALDVARAYFDSPASMPIFVRIPAEDRLDSEAGKVAQLNPQLLWNSRCGQELDHDLHGVPKRSGVQNRPRLLLQFLAQDEAGVPHSAR